jgi:ribose transport system permease protein
MIYAVGGFLTGLAGMIEFSSLVSGQPTAGVGYELRVIAAVVIGGGSLMGGEGTVSGTIAGALLMALLLNGCVLLHISDYVQQIVIGALIVVAVALDQLRKRKMEGSAL